MQGREVNFMYFNIIDEKLKLAECKIDDITFRQAEQLLPYFKKYGENNIMAFYDEVNDMIVFISEHKNYELYVEFAKSYLMLDEKTRKKEKNNFKSKDIKELVRVLDICSGINRTLYDENDTMKLIGKQMSYDLLKANYSYLKDILCANIRHNRDDLAMRTMEDAFILGYIEGKRAERARKKA